MAKTILIKRGTVANLPNLQEGEFGWATDTKELYVGDGAGAPVQVSYATVAALLAAYSLDASLTTLSLPDNTTISAFGKTLIDDADAAAALTTLGIDADIATFALPANTTISAFAKTLLDDTSASAMRATIGAANVPGVTYIDDYAVGDGTTDDTTAIGTAYTAASTGGILHFGPKTYKITDEITIAKALTVTGCGFSTQIKQATTGKGAFKVTASGVNIYDLYFNGVGHASYDSGEKAINIYGASYAAAISKVKVKNCFFANWGYGAIFAQYLTDFEFNDNQIDGVHYAGITTLSCVRGDVSGNKIDDIPGSAGTSKNAYGIILTRNPVDSLATDPRSAEITVERNRISNIPTWHGINTHAGSNLTISGNTVNGCMNGVVVVGCPDSAGNLAYAPFNVAVTGNVIDSGIYNGNHDADGANGIFVTGAYYDGSTVEYATGCSITGNVVIGHGHESGASDGGVYFYSTIGIIVSGNACKYCAPNGIVLDLENICPIVTGNSLIDIFSETTATIGINVKNGTNSSFLISDNICANVDATSTYKLDAASGVAVFVANAAGNSGKLGLITGNATTLLGDAGSKVSKNLNT